MQYGVEPPHAFPQNPQFASVDVKLTSQPLAAFPSQLP